MPKNQSNAHRDSDGKNAQAQRRRNRAAQEQAGQVEQQAAAAEQATEAEVELFMNGFTACLEAKDYVAKY